MGLHFVNLLSWSIRTRKTDVRSESTVRVDSRVFGDIGDGRFREITFTLCHLFHATIHAHETKRNEP